MDSSSEEQVFITCKVCDLPFTGVEPFEQHINGKKHHKRVRDKGKQSGDGALGLQESKDQEAQDFTCDICETAFSGIIPYTQHLKSNPHAKALRRKEAEEGHPTKFDDVSSDSELSDNDVDLNEMIKGIVPEPFGSCSICEKLFSGPEPYYEHMKSKSHSKRKYELKLLKKIKEKLNKSKGLSSEEVCKDNEAQVAEKNFAPDEEQVELECKECHKVFSGVISFAQHLASKVHIRTQNRNKLLEELKTLKALDSEGDSSASEDRGQVVIAATVDSVLTCDICSLAFSGPESAKAHLRSKRHQKTIKWKNYLEGKYKLARQGDSGHEHDTQKVLATKISEVTAVTDKPFDHDNDTEETDSSADTKTTEDAMAHGVAASAPAFGDYSEKCPPYQQVEEQDLSERLGHKNPDNLHSTTEDKDSKFLYPLLPDEDEQTEKRNTPVGNNVHSENNSSESESVTLEDDTKTTEDAMAHGVAASAPAFGDHSEICPSYQQVEEQGLSESLGHKNPDDLDSTTEVKDSKFSYPLLPDEDEQTEKRNTPVGNNVDSENNSSESESVTLEDEVVADCSKGPSDVDISSENTCRGKKKKSKVAKCKSGVGKLVTTMTRIFD